ncbi:MAG: exodeoxyribonuclease VII large subunit [Acidobacteria bacterium]|nr:exodeoxyribonuclease VII large subunit [Acidobacteriota bacterium]
MELRTGSNLPEYSVSQLAEQIKGTLEETFSRARVRGEISSFFRSGAGHLYWTLKDDRSGLKCACFRSAAQRLAVRPEDGLEVIVTGRVSTYGQRSEYQLIVDAVEVAGEGALLKMINDRRERLAAEGLFDEQRKRPIPYLPSVIGVVTSEQGAVIHDILHRLRERFPREVVLWPALVQGEGAAGQIAAGIAFFNDLEPGGPVSRPDVLIVGRGGGSVEDLMAFNEEVVARAIAASRIPVISAVGHETDTTIADFAADLRAPTPTAAAEMAVPVRAELRASLMTTAARLAAGLQRAAETRLARLETVRQQLSRPSPRIERLTQRVDLAWNRVVSDGAQRVARFRAALAHASGRLRTPVDQVRAMHRRTDAALTAADRGIGARYDRAELRLRLSADRPRLRGLTAQRLEQARRRWTAQARLLEASSHKRILERGFAIVQTGEDTLVRRAQDLAAGQAVTLLFQDSPPGQPTPARILEPVPDRQP